MEPCCHKQGAPIGRDGLDRPLPQEEININSQGGTNRPLLQGRYICSQIYA